jgi:hypothetical protein
MTDGRNKPKPASADAKAAREARLAAELRANLKRRKAAARAQKDGQDAPPAAKSAPDTDP